MSADVPSGAAPRRRGRWKRVVAWTALGIVLVVALAPLWAGPLLAGVVEGQIESRFDAEASVRAVSFSWPARLRARGVELVDGSGERLAALDELDARVALLPLLRGALHAELDVRYPELHVSRAADGRWNWERVLEGAGPEEPDEPSPPRDEGDLPDVVARVRLADGHVVIRGREGVTTISDIALEVDVDGLDRRAPFAVRLAVRGPRGPAGRLRVEGDFAPAAGGRLAPEEAAGRLVLALEELDLAALAPALSLAARSGHGSGGIEGLGGILAGEVELALEPGLALEGDADVLLRELTLRGPLATKPARIGDVRLQARATQQGEGAGTQRLELAAGSFLALTWDGRSSLPAAGAGEATGTLALEADLARVTELARGWVRFQEGVAVQGRLEHALELAATLRDREPVTASASARGGVTGLSARDASGRALDLSALRSITLELDAAADLVRETLEVPRLELSAGPLALSGKIAASDLAAPAPRLESGALRIDADLESLRGTLAQIVELAELPFGGRLTAEATLEARDDGGHALAAELDARELVLGESRAHELAGELSGRRGAAGELEVEGTLRADGVVLAAVEGGEPMALPASTVRLELRADARGEGRHRVAVETAEEALTLGLDARTERPDEDTLLVEAALSLGARLAPLAGTVSALLPLSAGLEGELDGGGSLRARIERGALAGAGGELELELTGLAATDEAGRALPLEALARTTVALAGELDARAGSAELRSLAIVASGIDVSASGRASGLAAGGRPAVEDGRVRLEADLARLGPDLARALELEWTVGGSPLVAEARIASDPAGGPMQWTGRLASAELALARTGEPPIVQRDLEVEFDLGYDAGAGSLHVRSARASSGTGSLSLRGTLNELADPARARGTMQLEVAAEIERVMADLGLEPPESGRATSGPLRGAFALDGNGGAFRVSGGATIEPFRLVLTPVPEAPDPARPADALGTRPPPAPIVVEEPRVALEVDARVALERLDLEIAKLTLASGLARGGAQGRVLGLGAPEGEPVRFERFTGQLAYVPDRLGAVLGPWLPGELRGSDEERVTFALDGALPELDLAGLIANADARVDLGLGLFVRPEIALGGALGLEAKDGKAILRGDLTANGGMLQLDGTLDLSDAPKPRSKLMATANALRLNAGLAPLLARVHPIFAGAELAQGRLDGLLALKLDVAYDAPLTVEQLEAGWDALPKTPIGGSGSIELKELSLRGSPLLATLAELGLRVPEKLAARPIQFTVQRGRLVYAEPWTWTIGDVQTTFTGSVGLDETLDLAWNVPITDEIVAKHSFMRFLGGETLSIPLRGTVRSPRLDVKGLLEDLTKEAAKRELESRLGLGSGGKDDPGELLGRADALWGKGEKAEAAKIYARLRDEFKLSLTYALNKDRIRERSRYKDQ